MLQYLPYTDRPGRRYLSHKNQRSTVHTGFNLFHVETDQVEGSLSHKKQSKRFFCEEGHRMDGVKTSQAEESAALFREYSTYRLQFIPCGDRPGRRSTRSKVACLTRSKVRDSSVRRDIEWMVWRHLRQRKAQLCSGSTIHTGFNLFHMETDQVEGSSSHKNQSKRFFRQVEHEVDGVQGLGDILGRGKRSFIQVVRYIQASMSPTKRPIWSKEPK
ncbi:hypothetical protein J6590_100521 [Homalodisca vitripennis]|nr:hypothetical protein J6590_100521 [Homalodisca vitripennis]